MQNLNSCHVTAAAFHSALGLVKAILDRYVKLAV